MKITDKQKEFCNAYLVNGDKRKIAKEHNVSATTIHSILKGNKTKHPEIILALVKQASENKQSGNKADNIIDDASKNTLQHV